MINFHKLKIAKDVAGWKGLMYLGPNYLLNKKLSDRVRTKPRAIQVEISSICNLRCSMCYIHELERNGVGVLTFEQFKDLIDRNFNYWHSIKLWGIGEPLLNKDLFKMIKYETSKGRYTNISTNGQLLTPEICEQIIDSGLNRLFVSIDTVDPVQYEKIRVGGKFEILERNLTYLVKLIKEKKKGPSINITTVAMKENISGIPQIIEFASKLGINRLLIQEIQVGKEGQTVDASETIKENEELSKRIKELVKLGKSKGIWVRAPEIKVKTKRESCVSPWMQAYVTKEGYITPCCRCISPKHYVCGNLFEQNLDEIWNNPKYITFRKLLRKGEPLPDICKNCTML
ncbi:MAG: radical SAM protein [Candidatus Woesearchaeota archaeon]